MAASAPNETYHSPVRDISLVGRWDARGESGAADVMIYAKVKPCIKVSLLHLQPLVLQSTLVRVVPLLPDGRSPWESPGVEALNIATVSGRGRGRGRGDRKSRPNDTSGLSFSRKAKHRMSIDGTGNTTDDDSVGSTSPSPSPSPSLSPSPSSPSPSPPSSSPFVESYDVDSAPLPNYASPIDFGMSPSSTTSTTTTTTTTSGSIAGLDEATSTLPFLGFEGLDVSLSGGVGLECDGVRGDGNGKTEEVIGEGVGTNDLISDMAPGRCWPPSSPPLELGMSPFEMSGNERRCVSFSRSATDGVMRRQEVGVYDWEKINMCSARLQRIDTTAIGGGLGSSSITDMPRVDNRGRIFSSGSFPSIRDASPIPERLIEELKHHGGTGSPSPDGGLSYGQDGAGEFKEKYREKLRGVRQGFLSDSQEDGPETQENERITISVENNALFLCFPPHIREGDPVVVEILLSVKPILLGQNRNYYTFIFSGLPYCENVAFFDFTVDADDEEWVFDAGDHDQTAVFEPLVLYEPNRLRGQLHLKDKTPTQRSIIVRIQHVPSHVEIYDFSIRTKTSALFSWTPDGKTVADFEIKVFFVDIEAVENVARNLVNLIIVNGIEEARDITITSASGNRERFSLEGPVMKDGQELQSARLLQVSRLVRDVPEAMTISFRKVQKSLPCYFHFPLIELGSHDYLLEQIVVIHEPLLPLNMSFTPDAAYWRDLNEEKGLPGSIKISRIPGKPTIEYPRVWVNSLEPVTSAAADVLFNFNSHLKFIDKLTCEVEEHSPPLWKSLNPMPIHLIMSFELECPPKDGAELLRMHRGSFQIEFATINGVPAKMLFIDDDELVMLNYGQLYANEPMQLSLYWEGMQTLTINTVGCGKMLEYQLPCVHESVVGRVVCKYQRETARIASRTHFLEAGAWTVGFSNGRATLSGLQTFNSRLYLQIPLIQHPVWPPISQAASIEDAGDDTAEEILFENPVYDNASSLDGAAAAALIPPPDQDFLAANKNPPPLDGAFDQPLTIDLDAFASPPTGGGCHSNSPSRVGKLYISTAAFIIIAVLVLCWSRPEIGEHSLRQGVQNLLGESRYAYDRFESVLMSSYADILGGEGGREGEGEGEDDGGGGDGSDGWVGFGSGYVEEGHPPPPPWEEQREGRVMVHRESFMGLFFGAVEDLLARVLRFVSQ